MNDDMFEFDIDAQLEQAEAKAAEKASEVPADISDEADCEGKHGDHDNDDEQTGHFVFLPYILKKRRKSP